MNQREAKRRQQLIWDTLIGMKALLVDDTTLLQEMDPDQERLFKDLVGIAVHKDLVEL